MKIADVDAITKEFHGTCPTKKVYVISAAIYIYIYEAGLTWRIESTLLSSTGSN